MTFIKLQRRIVMLETVKTNSPKGGVVTELRTGGYEHYGKRYENLEDIPGRFMLIPEPLSCEEFEKLAREQQQKFAE